MRTRVSAPPVDFHPWLKYLRQPATDFCFYDHDFDCLDGLLTSTGSATAAMAEIAEKARDPSSTPSSLGTCANPGYNPVGSIPAAVGEATLTDSPSASDALPEFCTTTGAC